MNDHAGSTKVIAVLHCLQLASAQACMRVAGIHTVSGSGLVLTMTGGFEMLYLLTCHQALHTLLQAHQDLHAIAKV